MQPCAFWGEYIYIYVHVNNISVLILLYREAGIPEMLDVDDMVAVRIPDPRSIMTFLVTIYQHFN